MYVMISDKIRQKKHKDILISTHALSNETEKTKVKTKYTQALRNGGNYRLERFSDPPCLSVCKCKLRASKWLAHRREPLELILTN